MVEPRARAAPTDPRERVRRAWDANAAFWDERMAEGNLFHQHLLLPTLERLLGLGPGTEVLEVACGNGQLARWMATRGARVTAVDVSEGMLARARARGLPGPGTIRYSLLDASDAAALRTLDGGPFEVVVCNMALMDMAEIEPLAGAVPDLLAPRGRFVFSVCHPFFNASDARKIAEASDEGGTLVDRRSVVVGRYLTARSSDGLAMIGQPAPQPYFERPLSGLLGPFLRAGLVVDALEEPRFPPDLPDRGYWHSWVHLLDLPPALLVRMVRSPAAEPDRGPGAAEATHRRRRSTGARGRGSHP